jgi:hypothetical protein
MHSKVHGLGASPEEVESLHLPDDSLFTVVPG